MNTWYRNFDFATFFAWLGLTVCGLVAIYSTTHGPASVFLPESVQHNFTRQLSWVAVCIVGIGLALLMPVRFFQQLAYPFYAVCIGLLLLTLAVGREVSGSQSWLFVGGFGIQVAEVAKVGAVMAVARLLASRRPDANNVRYAIGALLLLIVPAGIIIMQNETGTALVFLALIPIMLFWSGLPLPTVMLVISPAIAGYFAIVYMPAAIVFAVLFTLYLYWKTRERYMAALAALFTGGLTAVIQIGIQYIFQPYQLARIISFTNPGAEEWRSGVGYQLVQAKAAVGSGGFLGKGFMQGTQTQGAYIPEQSTDFIFSVIGEEFGFVGAIIVLVLFAVLLTRLVWMGTAVKHPFGSMIAAATAGVFLIHIIINVGMVTGLVPIIGIPLPFVSYGGSAMIANTAMLAIVLDLHMRRDDFSIYGY